VVPPDRSSFFFAFTFRWRLPTAVKYLSLIRLFFAAVNPLWAAAVSVSETALLVANIAA
jgi:hypothetical protein